MAYHPAAGAGTSQPASPARAALLSTRTHVHTLCPRMTPLLQAAHLELVPEPPFGKFLCTALCRLAISFAICQAGLSTCPGSGSAHAPQQDDGLLLDASSIRSVTGQPDVHRWNRASIPLKCHLNVVHLTMPVEQLHLSEN